MSTTPEILLINFINQKLLADTGSKADVLTPLFREGWIDSLKILQLIAFVEVQRGADIPDREIVMDRFQNVHAICEHFLSGPTEQNL